MSHSVCVCVHSWSCCQVHLFALNVNVMLFSLFNVDTVLKAEVRVTLDPRIETFGGHWATPAFHCETEVMWNVMWRWLFESLPSLFFPDVCQSKAVLCPMSGRPIKMNELITVRFTPLDSSLDRVALLTRQVSFCLHLVVHHRGQSYLMHHKQPGCVEITNHTSQHTFSKAL